MNRPLHIAVLLIASGGFVDAYTFLAYDHVFTNAQSGNVVLLAVHLAALQGSEALKHLPALLAFFPGVLAGQAIAARPAVGGVRSDAAVLAAELVLLLVVALAAPPLSAATVTFGISFVSAMQNTAFKKAGGTSYTSVVTTGNLRAMSEALYAGWSRRDAAALHDARILGAISAAFALGALGGGAATLAWGRPAIGVPATLIALALVACLRQDAPPRT